MDKRGFDNQKYLELQSAHIRERIRQFGNKLYLEFGGKLFDDHASGSHRYSAYFPREKDLGLPGGLCRGGSHLGGIYLPALRETALRGGEEHD